MKPYLTPDWDWNFLLRSRDWKCTVLFWLKNFWNACQRYFLNQAKPNLRSLYQGLESLHLNARTSLLESGKLNLRRFESLHTLAMCCPGLNSVLFPSTITDLTLVSHIPSNSIFAWSFNVPIKIDQRRSTRINGGSLADLPTSLTRLTLTETFEARTTPFKKLHPFATCTNNPISQNC